MGKINQTPLAAIVASYKQLVEIRAVNRHNHESIRSLGRRIGVPETTLWRFFSLPYANSKLDLAIMIKLEADGFFKGAIIEETQNV